MAKFFKSITSLLIIVSLTFLFGVFIVPRLFGYDPYMVLSGSMAKVYPVGSLIYVKAAVPEQIEVGDPIMYELSEGSEIVVTHRVVSKDDDTRTFVTKGDNNNVGETVSYDALRGKATDFAIPMLGYFSAWFSTLSGKVIVCSLSIALILLNIVLGKFTDNYSDDNNVRKEE